MQYERVNRKMRAQEYRRAAKENADAGYRGFADVAWEMAEWVDPTPRKDNRRGRN